MNTVGEVVWNRLRAEGGFVWTTADGRKIVSFNKGRHPSAELARMLRKYREELKDYIDAMHAARDRALGRPPALGSSRTFERNAPNGRDCDIRECNGAARSEISPGSPEKWDFDRRRGSAAVSPAISAVLAAVFAAFSEIQGAPAHAPGGSVGLVGALLTYSSSGGGAWVCLADSGVNTKTGR